MILESYEFYISTYCREMKVIKKCISVYILTESYLRVFSYRNLSLNLIISKSNRLRSQEEED